MENGSRPVRSRIAGNPSLALLCIESMNFYVVFPSFALNVESEILRTAGRQPADSVASRPNGGQVS